VILPALNEEHGILETINQIGNHIHSAKILVVDNGSTDRTTEIVKAAGMQIVFEPRIGKGFAVRRAFSYLPPDVNCVFMVDSDGTYSVSEFPEAHKLIVEQGFDMVVGNRKIRNDLIHGRLTEFRSGHVFGNWAISKLSKILQPSNILDSL
jgi:glycosyltransferase involved in cell wall biosynthesis